MQYASTIQRPWGTSGAESSCGEGKDLPSKASVEMEEGSYFIQIYRKMKFTPLSLCRVRVRGRGRVRVRVRASRMMRGLLYGIDVLAPPKVN